MSCALQLVILRSNVCHVNSLLSLARQTLHRRALSSFPKLSRSLKESYRLLQLPEEGSSTPAEVKEAYLRMAKLYHPDSGAATADSALFARVEEAYRAVLAHHSQSRNRRAAAEVEEEDNLKGVAPQHRHYLSYEGLGAGTLSQRERQYRQFRVDRAVEQVLDYRQREFERAAASEGAMVERDMRQRSRKIKITQAVERLVEDLIQESMARGDFQNLSGAGKPLNKFEHNPYSDPMTHNLNRILIDNGYQPPWIITQREIRETTELLRTKLLKGRTRLGEPMTPRESSQWKQLCNSVGGELVKLNKMVDNFNLIVPMLSSQMVHFSLEREIKRAEKRAHKHRHEIEKERQIEIEKSKEENLRLNASQRKSLLSWIQNLLLRGSK
ncbi:dnaJ homolog subfamily C member 28 [Aplochiton taeniatus]